MSKYLVRAVRVENGEVEAAHVSLIGNIPDQPGKFGVDDGKILERADLASLVKHNELYAATIPAVGEYGVGQRVRTKPGQMEYLTSIDGDGNPTGDLLDLPKLT